ncbi:hypothetical protein VNI00_019125 [Paramarasmius palmivorus]|uniref:Uncharacterized protein n=1 Tax=Paramarasmius palmivorus TaxID=297713 RepID=A0AAW0AR75_9AGAR
MQQLLQLLHIWGLEIDPNYTTWRGAVRIKDSGSIEELYDNKEEFSNEPKSLPTKTNGTHSSHPISSLMNESMDIDSDDSSSTSSNCSSIKHSRSTTTIAIRKCKGLPDRDATAETRASKRLRSTKVVAEDVMTNTGRRKEENYTSRNREDYWRGCGRACSEQSA